MARSDGAARSLQWEQGWSHVEVAAALVLPPHRCHHPTGTMLRDGIWLAATGAHSLCHSPNLIPLLLVARQCFPGMDEQGNSFPPPQKQTVLCMPSTAAGAEVLSVLHGGRFLLSVPSPRSQRNQISPEEATRPLSLATTARAKPGTAATASVIVIIPWCVATPCHLPTAAGPGGALAAPHGEGDAGGAAAPEWGYGHPGGTRAV